MKYIYIYIYIMYLYIYILCGKLSFVSYIFAIMSTLYQVLIFIKNLQERMLLSDDCNLLIFCF